MTHRIVTQCTDQLVETLQSIANIKKTFLVYSAEHLMDSNKGITYPCAGVIYEGMRPYPEEGKSTHKVGVSNEFVASIVLLTHQDIISKDTYKSLAIEILDDFREEMFKTVRKSPSGHFWRFLFEAPASVSNGVVAYVQRWSTPVQLTY